MPLELLLIICSRYALQVQEKERGEGQERMTTINLRTLHHEITLSILVLPGCLFYFFNRSEIDAMTIL